MADGITLSKAELQALLDGVAEKATKNTLAAVTEMMAQRGSLAPQIGQHPDLPSDKSPDQQKEIAYAKATGQPVQDRTPKEELRIPCLTAKGASFIAIVVKGERYPGGICVRLDNYVEPNFTDKVKPLTLDKDGNYGVPEGLYRNGTDKPLFKQWKWRTFWQEDLSRYVGHDARELPRAPTPAAKTESASKAA
jgi:hypothetical protein